jgi:hypothetical protein
MTEGPEMDEGLVGDIVLERDDDDPRKPSKNITTIISSLGEAFLATSGSDDDDPSKKSTNEVQDPTAIA